MKNMETIFPKILRTDMLERMNKTSKVLQSKDVNILVATNLLVSMKTYLQKLEINLVNMNSKPGVCVQIHITVMRKNGNKNKVCVVLDRLTIYDGSSAAEEVLLNKSKFKVETFHPILDTNL